MNKTVQRFCKRYFEKFYEIKRIFLKLTSGQAVQGSNWLGTYFFLYGRPIFKQRKIFDKKKFSLSGTKVLQPYKWTGAKQEKS